MDENNESSKAQTPLLKGIKKIVTIPKITPVTRKDSEARKLAYVEFSGTVSTKKTVIKIETSIHSIRGFKTRQNACYHL